MAVKKKRLCKGCYLQIGSKSGLRTGSSSLRRSFRCPKRKVGMNLLKRNFQDLYFSNLEHHSLASLLSFSRNQACCRLGFTFSLRERRQRTQKHQAHWTQVGDWFRINFTEAFPPSLDFNWKKASTAVDSFKIPRIMAAVGIVVVAIVSMCRIADPSATESLSETSLVTAI